MQDQNYKNHTRFVPLYHYVLYTLILLILVVSVYKLYKSYHFDYRYFWLPATFFVTGIALLLVSWFARVFALKAQDRAIRAEENLRHYVLAGKLLDKRLRPSQIVALRFAEDNEFVNLAAKAAAENLSSKQIKEAIKNWRADHHRV